MKRSKKIWMIIILVIVLVILWSLIFDSSGVMSLFGL